MVAKRPSIYIYIDNPDQELLREICAGIEEEGVFYEIIDRAGEELKELTWNAANDSMLGSGVGIKGSNVAFMIRGQKPGQFIDYYAYPSREESRRIGANSARAIKKCPFKES